MLVTLTITPGTASKTYGQTLALNSYSVAGSLISGDTIGSVSLTSAGTAASAGAGTYDITASNAVFSSGSASNYAITYQMLSNGLTVNKASLTVTANNASKVYDNVVYSGGNGVSYSGFVGSDSAASLGGIIIYGGTSQGAANAGSYTITASGLTSGNYTISYQPGTLTVTSPGIVVAGPPIVGTTSNAVLEPNLTPPPLTPQAVVYENPAANLTNGKPIMTAEVCSAGPTGQTQLSSSFVVVCSAGQN